MIEMIYKLLEAVKSSNVHLLLVTFLNVLGRDKKKQESADEVPGDNFPHVLMNKKW